MAHAQVPAKNMINNNICILICFYITGEQRFSLNFDSVTSISGIEEKPFISHQKYRFEKGEQGFSSELYLTDI